MVVLRWLIGRIILLLNFVFSPRSPKLSQQELTVLKDKTAHLSLYQLPACPFCVKVRRAMKRQGLAIELRNVKQENLREELIEQGGKRTVPCLRIAEPGQQVKWLYESNDIIEHLKQYAA